MDFPFFMKDIFYWRLYLVFYLYAINDNCCNANLRHDVRHANIAYIVDVYCLFVRYTNTEML